MSAAWITHSLDFLKLPSKFEFDNGWNVSWWSNLYLHLDTKCRQDITLFKNIPFHIWKKWLFFLINWSTITIILYFRSLYMDKWRKVPRDKDVNSWIFSWFIRAIKVEIIVKKKNCTHFSAMFAINHQKAFC